MALGVKERAAEGTAVTRLSFMEPVSRFMFWVSVAAWVAVAAAFLLPRRARPQDTEDRHALLISNSDSRIK
jgi:hypothetical protein